MLSSEVNHDPTKVNKRGVLVTRMSTPDMCYEAMGQVTDYENNFEAVVVSRSYFEELKALERKYGNQV